VELRGEKVILRDMQMSDLVDYIHWNTIEIEWQTEWDAPWAYEVQTVQAVTEEMTAFVERYLKPSGMRRHFEVCLLYGLHIGWVNSYYIDDDKSKLAVGIDIPPVSHRGKGYGRDALELFIRYLQNNGLTDIYTQTWSGNMRMIKLAENMGFVEVSRIKDKRVVHGKVYDALTFKLDLPGDMT